MSLINSLFAGVSGLRNHQSMMDVIGNNIANVNSIGFKGSRVTFSDTFNQFVKAGSNPTETSGGTNSFQIGLGTKIASIDRNWNQGTFERTGIVTDLALQGPGLFVMKSNGETFYTRAGSFIFDQDGYLVNPTNGGIVQGKIAADNGLGSIPAGNTLQDIKLDNNLRLPAIATTEAVWGGNLNSQSTITRTENVVQSGNISLSVADGDDVTPDPINSIVYDDNGREYRLNVNYNKTTDQTYEMEITLLDADGNSALVDGTGTTVASYTYDVVFNAATGAMSTIDFGSGAVAADSFAITNTGLGINFDLDVTAVMEADTASSTLSQIADSNEKPTKIQGSVTIFDSLGESHTMTITFTKTASNTWNWNAEVPATSGTLTQNYGNIIFNSDGSIASIVPANPAAYFAPTGGADAQVVSIDFGNLNDFSGITQTAIASNVAALSQNGAASATLSNINIDQYGKVIGVFSNGNTRELAQIMTATFSNRSGLISVGDNMYQISANTGVPLISELGETSSTTIQSGALEQSNVDLSEEFTKMIVSQRGFQANARVITTADTLLQEITNLVR